MEVQSTSKTAAIDRDALEDGWRACTRPVVFAYGNGGIGDKLLTLPAVQALERLFGARLVIACDRFSKTYIYAGLRTCRLVELSDRANGSGLDLLKLADAIDDCDLLLCLNTGVHQDMHRLARVFAPRYSVGFSPGFKKALSVSSALHAADLPFQVPRALDATLRIEDFHVPRLGADHRERARLVRGMLPDTAKVLGIHPDTKPYKMWPLDRMRELVHRFLGSHPDYFVFVFGTECRCLEEGPHGARVVSLAGLPLATLFALAGEIDRFVGIVSCFLHAADLHGVPGVGLFGPTDPRQWGFRFAPHVHVCARDLAAVGVDEVLDALESLDDDSGAARALARGAPVDGPSPGGQAHFRVLYS